MIEQSTRLNFVNPSKTQVIQLTKQYQQWQDYQSGKKILRFLRKKRKYGIREYHNKWYWIKRFKKKNYWRKK